MSSPAGHRITAVLDGNSHLAAGLRTSSFESSSKAKFKSVEFFGLLCFKISFKNS